jgi:hypothetical protein
VKGCLTIFYHAGTSLRKTSTFLLVHKALLFRRKGIGAKVHSFEMNQIPIKSLLQTHNFEELKGKDYNLKTFKHINRVVQLNGLNNKEKI